MEVSERKGYGSVGLGASRNGGENGNKYGFYCSESRKFFMIPVSSEEEFKLFMATIEGEKGKKSGQLDRDEVRKRPTSEQMSKREENFDDFDLIVEKIMRAPDSEFSKELMMFDL